MGEEGKQAPRQGNLSQRLCTDPFCQGTRSWPALLACRTRSFARSQGPGLRRRVCWNCSHCWAPIWAPPPHHCHHSAASGSSSVSPLRLPHSRKCMVLSHKDAHMLVPMLRLAGYRCQAGAGPRGSAVGARSVEHRRNQLGERERAGPGCQSGIQIQPPARRRRRHPDPPSPPPAPGCRGQTNCKPQGPGSRS